jgi:hypothetical protein
MEEIIKQVASKAGISPDQAKTAVETVVNFLKDKLPMVAAPLQQLLGGSEGASGGGSSLADAAKSLGGMFGKKE